MGVLNSKSKFMFYNDIKLHNCIEIRGKKKERAYYYQYLSGLTMDLNAVMDPSRYRKKVCFIQPDCSCSKNKVTLAIYKQIAISNYYKPCKTYEYKTRHDVITKNGFNYWIHEITRSIWENDKEFDSFISGLVPGLLFYDGIFIKKIAEKMLQKLNFDSPSIKDQPEFLESLNNFIDFAAELKDNSVVVNQITSNRNN